MKFAALLLYVNRDNKKVSVINPFNFLRFACAWKGDKTLQVLLPADKAQASKAMTEQTYYRWTFKMNLRHFQDRIPSAH